MYESTFVDNGDLLNQGSWTMRNSRLVWTHKWSRKHVWSRWAAWATPLRQMWWLHEDRWTGDVQQLVVAIVPSRPVDELMIGLPEQIEEKLRRHIVINDLLQPNKTTYGLLHKWLYNTIAQPNDRTSHYGVKNITISSTKWVPTKLVEINATYIAFGLISH